jgi:hypothetical protein
MNFEGASALARRAPHQTLTLRDIGGMIHPHYATYAAARTIRRGNLGPDQYAAINREHSLYPLSGIAFLSLLAVVPAGLFAILGDLDVSSQLTFWKAIYEIDYEQPSPAMGQNPIQASSN